MERATACAPRPAALTTSLAPIRDGLTPPVRSAEPDEIRHAIGFRLGLDRRELFDLRGARRNQELPAPPMRHIEFLAEGVEHRLAVHA
jgi:hypothetical protein